MSGLDGSYRRQQSGGGTRRSLRIACGSYLRSAMQGARMWSPQASRASLPPALALVVFPDRGERAADAHENRPQPGRRRRASARSATLSHRAMSSAIPHKWGCGAAKSQRIVLKAARRRWVRPHNYGASLLIMARRWIACGRRASPSDAGRAFVTQFRAASLPPVPAVVSLFGWERATEARTDCKPRQLRCASAINASIRAGSAIGARPSRTAREVSGSLAGRRRCRCPSCDRAPAALPWAVNSAIAPHSSQAEATIIAPQACASTLTSAVYSRRTRSAAARRRGRARLRRTSTPGSCP